MQIFSLRPYEGSEPYVYVSFYYLDADAVYPLLERIGRSGCRVWYTEEYAPGTRFTPFSQAMLAGADSFLLFLSPNALQSDAIRRELSAAMDRGMHTCAVQLEPMRFSPETEPRLFALPSIDKSAFENEDRFFARLLGVHIPARCFDAQVRAAVLQSLPALPPEPETPAPEKPAPAAKKKNRVPLTAALFAGAIGLAVLIGFSGQKKEEAPAPAQAVQTTQAANPAVQAERTAADALPEALRDFAFTLAGERYNLPCKLSAFTENGWEVASAADPANTKLLSGGSRAVTLKKEGAAVTVTFYNRTESEKTLADCPIGGIDCKASGGADLTLAEGIGCLSAPEEIRAVFGEPTKESVRGDYTVLNYATDEFSVYTEFVCYRNGKDQSRSSVRLRNFAG